MVLTAVVAYLTTHSPIVDHNPTLVVGQRSGTQNETQVSGNKDYPTWRFHFDPYGHGSRPRTPSTPKWYHWFDPQPYYPFGCESKPMVPFWPFWGRCTILVYFSGDWDVDWGYRILTHTHFGISETVLRFLSATAGRPAALQAAQCPVCLFAASPRQSRTAVQRKRIHIVFSQGSWPMPPISIPNNLSIDVQSAE